jgi:hypothetical protein
MGKTLSKPLAARHGRGAAWARHAMCESAFRNFQFNQKESLSLLVTLVNKFTTYYAVRSSLPFSLLHLWQSGFTQSNNRSLHRACSCKGAPVYYWPVRRRSNLQMLRNGDWNSAAYCLSMRGVGSTEIWCLWETNYRTKGHIHSLDKRPVPLYT